MSANNYTECPRCAAKIQSEQRELQRQLDEGYGTLPQKEYLELLRERQRRPPSTPNQNALREDWEIGMVGDQFDLWYSAMCCDCGFKFTYKYHCSVLEPQP